MCDRAWLHVSVGLLTFEHYERLGPAVLLFLWFVHEQRKPKDGEPDSGVVRNGELITYPQISALRSSACLGAPSSGTLPYLSARSTSEAKKCVALGNAIGSRTRSAGLRWRARPTTNLEAQDVPTTNVAKGDHNSVEAPTTSLSQSHHKFVESNKEARTKNKPNNTKNSTRAPTFTRRLQITTFPNGRHDEPDRHDGAGFVVAIAERLSDRHFLGRPVVAQLRSRAHYQRFGPCRVSIDIQSRRPATPSRAQTCAQSCRPPDGFNHPVDIHPKPLDDGR
jgi:hypothetical protein